MKKMHELTVKYVAKVDPFTKFEAPEATHSRVMSSDTVHILLLLLLSAFIKRTFADATNALHMSDNLLSLNTTLIT